MNDDEPGGVIKRTDLSDEIPTPRAVFRHHREEIQVEAHTGRLGGTAVKLRAKVLDGSPQSMAMTTLELALAIGIVTGIAFGIGIPPIGALIAGVCVPLGTYMLVYLTSGRRHRR